MSITIRKAVAGDASEIARIHTQSWQSTYRGIIDDTFLDTLDAIEKAKWWDAVIGQGASVYVAATDHLLGFASVGRSREKGEYQGELYAIYLLKEEQGKGVGKMLFDAVKNDLRSKDINSMMVWVLKDNPSRDFYIKQGGKYLTETEVEIGKQKLMEEAYGWHF